MLIKFFKNFLSLKPSPDFCAQSSVNCIAIGPVVWPAINNIHRNIETCKNII